MSFRKRNVGIVGPSTRTPQSSPGSPQEPSCHHEAQNPPSNPFQIPGIRSSPLDGRPTTSTGTQSLDNLLAGHGGLALGNSILIEESGTTDYAGTLLRYYAAEGVVQGHKVHAVGVGEHWGRELPGLVGGGVEGSGDGAGNNKTAESTKERMKIAWRYERLGEFGEGSAGSRGGTFPFVRPVYSRINTFYVLATIVLLCANINSSAASRPHSKRCFFRTSSAGFINSFLPHFRSHKTPHAAKLGGPQFHTRTNHRFTSLAIHIYRPNPLRTALFFEVRHNPPPSHPLSSVTSHVSV